ncbi:uncharacterized protein [Mytilus edulis]|uniref:uncharacterized protein n=1 Tax=Mytilus edulis TaxID=6550 RepID=UPI0039EF797F
MATAASWSCEPCSQRKKKTEASKWCTDCEESMCQTCTDCHLSMKATKRHHIIDLQVAHSCHSNPLTGIHFCEKHEGHPFEYFCKDHNAICCNECMSTKLHRSCKIHTIKTCSTNVKTSQNFKDVETEIDHAIETLTSISEDRIANTTSIKGNVEDVKKSIKRFKSNILQHLDTLEVAIFQDLDRMQEEMSIKLNDEKDQAETDKEVVSVYKKQIQFISNHGSDKQAFLCMHKLKMALHNLTNQQIGKIARMRALSIEHTIPEELLSCLSLGSVVPKDNLCTEKFKLHVEDFKFYQNFHLHKKVDMTAIDKQAFITGMAVSGDKLLLCNCDWNHHMPQVLVFKKSGEYLANIEVKGAPWDIAVLPRTDQAVVVLPNTNSIQFIDTLKQVSGREIKMAGSDEKRGIAATDDKIFVGGMDRIVYILDHDGNLMSTIFSRGEKFCYLLSVSNCDLVYSDFSSIHRIKLDGSEVYSYKSPNLRNPKKIATDQLGNLYVAGKDSHNIHRITPDGTFLDIVLTEVNGIHHPRAMYFDNSSNMLFISNQSGKELLIFNCT